MLTGRVIVLTFLVFGYGVQFLVLLLFFPQTGWVKKYSELEYAKVKPASSSSSSNDDEARSLPSPRGNPFLRLFGLKRSASAAKSKETQNEGNDDGGNDATTTESSPSTTTSPAANKRNKPSPATLTRYVLASTALALVGCNIYLFVAQ